MNDKNVYVFNIRFYTLIRKTRMSIFVCDCLFGDHAYATLLACQRWRSESQEQSSTA